MAHSDTPGPARSNAELEALLADRERRLRELTDQTLGLLDQLTEARERTEGGRQELERRIASLEQQLTSAERRVRRSGRRTLRPEADAAPGDVEFVCWGSWQAEALAEVAETVAPAPVRWLVGDAPTQPVENVEAHVAPTPTAAHAFNEAVAASEAAWIVLLAAGQVPASGSLDLPDDESLALASVAHESAEGRRGSLAELDATLAFRAVDAAEPGAAVDFALPEAFALRRRACREVGTFDEGIRGPLALMEWTLRAREAGLTVVQAALQVHGPQLEDRDGDRDRLVVLARHRPDQLGSALGRCPLLWRLPAPELGDFVRGLIDRMGRHADTALLHAVMTGLCTHTLPERDAVPALRAAVTDLHRTLRHELHQLPEPMRDPQQVSARGAPSGREAPAVLSGWIAEMARAGLDARTALAGVLDQARQSEQRLQRENHELRLNLQVAQNGAREAQTAHKNAVAAIENLRAQVANRDERIAAQGGEIERIRAEMATLAQRAQQAATARAEADTQRAEAEQRIQAAHARLEQNVQQLRQLELELEEAREREGDATRRLEALREHHRHELDTLADAVRLTGSPDVGTVRTQLAQMADDLQRFGSALDQSGEPSPESLVQRLIELRGILRERNDWIGKLLEELAHRRIKLRPRGLQPHEEEFLARLRRPGGGNGKPLD